jgi:hypothetical protein
MANEPNGQPADTLDEAELDARARKRIEVGLSPRRPTAKTALQRPPDVQTLPLPPWVLALVLLVVLLLTAALLAANLTGWSPAWWTAATAPLTRSGATEALPADPLTPDAATLVLSDDFSQPTSTLLQSEQRQEWRTELLPAESIYRIQVWPGHLAWSLIGLDAVERYRLQTDTLVTTTAPDGYAGLVARYQDARHFYLFAVDGHGRYLVQLQDGDQMITVQPWTPVPYLNSAGSSNLLAIEDTGIALRFYGNGMLLYELADPAYTPGLIGLAGGSAGQDVAELHFDWLQLYQAAESGSTP